MKSVSSILSKLFIFIMAIITLFPFVYMILASLMTFQEATSIPPTLIPKVPQWNNFIVALRKNDNSLYYWLRADNYGRNAADVVIPFPHSGTQWVNQTWEEWLQSMNGAEVTVYVTNCGNGTADVQIEMIGNDKQLDTQYYLGANAIDPDDLNFALSVDGCHLVFK